MRHPNGNTDVKRVLEVNIKCRDSAQEVPASNSKDDTLNKIKM